MFFRKLFLFLFFITNGFFASAYAVTQQFNLPSDQWRQISFPFANDSASNTVSHVLGDNFPGAVYGTDWVLYAYDPTLPEPGYVNPGIDGQLKRGVGYWIVQQTGQTVTLDFDDQQPTAAFEISLFVQQGSAPTWNMIGYPVDTPMELANAFIKTDTGACAGSNGCDIDQAETAGYVSATLYNYNGTDQYDQLATGGANTSLAPWSGYWIAALPDAFGRNPRIIFPEQNTTVVINEFVASNATGLQDGDGDYSDWVELHNTGSAIADISGWCLTDKASEPQQWCFPAGTSLPADGYVIVFASKKNPGPTGEFHAQMKLKSGGEYLALLKPDGSVVDSFDPFPHQATDISYGRDSTGQFVYFSTPTPGAANGAGVADILLFSAAAVHTNGSETKQVSLSSLSANPSAYTLTTDASWLSAVTATGEDAATPDLIDITTDATGLADGTYTATVSATAAGHAPATVQVSMVISTAAAISITQGETSQQSGGAGSVSFAHNLTAANNRMIIVGASIEAQGHVGRASVTYGGVAMHPVPNSLASIMPGSFSISTEFFYLTETDLDGLPAGSQAVLISHDGNDINAGVLQVNNVKQVAPADIATSAADAPSSMNTSINSSSADALLVDIIGGGQPQPAFTTVALQNLFWGTSAPSSQGAGSTRLIQAPGSYNMQWSTTGTNRAAHSVIALAPAIDATPLNAWPVLDPVSNQSVQEGSTSQVNLAASDADGDTLTFSSSVLPGFMALLDNHDGTGSLTIAPQAADVGSYTITIFVSDGVHAAVSKTLTVNILPAQATTSVQINELLASNANTNLDPDNSAFSDWLELYNAGNQAVDISGYYLSDDPAQVQQWQIPANTVIPAGGYLLFWADGTDQNSNGLHTNFKLSSKGETITLADSSGVVIDTVIFGKQQADISVGRSGSSIVYLTPTPGQANGAAHSDQTRSDDPVFSVDAGFYDASQSVAISQVNGAQIYYTTDGSIPTTASTLYTQPIQVSLTTAVRAIAVENGKFPSDVVTRTFFIGEDRGIPVISVTVNPDYLFDSAVGIYADGNGTVKNFLQDWKRPANFEYFDINNLPAFELAADLSISGEVSRGLQKKSFAVDLDSKYGTKTLKYALYQDKPDVNKIKDFKIRDSYGNNDILSSLIVKRNNLNIDYQSYQVVRLYVNGELWGVYNLREKKSKDFLASNYPDLDTKKLDIISVDRSGVKAGSAVEFDNLFNFIKNNDLSVDANYQTLLTMIDEDNYLDYMIFMIYSANSDWIANNARWWREQKPGAKWRWMLDDVDTGFTRSEGANFDSFAFMNSNRMKDYFISVLFNKIMLNPTFKQKFVSRFTNYLDTVFAPDNVRAAAIVIADERRDFIQGGRFAIYTQDADDTLTRQTNFAIAREAYLRTVINNL